MILHGHRNRWLLGVALATGFAVAGFSPRPGVARSPVDEGRAVALARAAEDRLDRDPESALLLAAKALSECECTTTLEVTRKALVRCGGIRPLRGHWGPIAWCSATTSGEWLATGDYAGEIRLWTWRAPTGRLIRRTGSECTFRGMFVPGEDTLIVLDDAGLWKWQDPWQEPVRLHADEKHLPIHMAVSRSHVLVLYNDERPRTFPLSGPASSTAYLGRPVRLVALSSDGRTVVGVSGKREVLLWRVGEEVAFSTFPASDDVTCLAVGEGVVVLGTATGKLEVIEVASKARREGQVGKSQVTCMEISPDSREVVFGTRTGAVGKRELKTLTGWETGEREKDDGAYRVHFVGRSGAVVASYAKRECLLFNSDGSVLRSLQAYERSEMRVGLYGSWTLFDAVPIGDGSRIMTTNFGRTAWVWEGHPHDRWRKGAIEQGTGPALRRLAEEATFREMTKDEKDTVARILDGK